MRRHAFTLVETLVGCVILAVLFTVLWFVFSGGHAGFRKGGDLTEAIGGALLLCEHLETDCRQLAVPRADATAPVETGDAGTSLTLFVATTKRTEADGAGLATVAWRLDGADRRGVSRLLRNGKALSGVYLKSWTVTFFPLAKDEKGEMQYLRVEGTATDRAGGASFPFVRLLALPVPAVLASRRGA